MLSSVGADTSIRRHILLLLSLTPISGPLNFFISLFGLVRFYGISTIVGYLMPNSFYTYILIIYDLVW